MSTEIKMIVDKVVNQRGQEIKVAYHSDTEFLVQIGYGKKGAYITQYRTQGDLAQAIFLYNAINIGLGYKKRLRAPGFNRPLLARHFS